MAQRFINNLTIGPDYSEKEVQEIKLYKQVASLLELNPIFVHAEVAADISGDGTVSQIGTEISYDVRDINKLNETIYNKYVWEVSLLDCSITSYSDLIGGSVPRPTQPLFIKIDNLTSEPYDFVCSQPIEKQNNRVIYLNQKTFPDRLLVKFGHCVSDQKADDFGKFFDFNTNVGTPGITSPYFLFYNQKTTLIRFRLQIRQIHTA